MVSRSGLGVFGFGRCVSTAAIGRVYLQSRFSMQAYSEQEGGKDGGPLLVTTIRLWRELDDGVQRDLDVG